MNLSRILICLVRWWNSGFFAIASDPVLSPYNSMRSLHGCPISADKVLNYNNSLAASLADIYSASVVDSAITRCTFETHDINDP